MDRARTLGWLVEASGWTRGVHAVRIPAKQRLHLAALLALLLALQFAPTASAQSGDDISLDPAITEAEFAAFSRLAAQAIYHTPVEPARAGNLLRFDIGVAATAVPVDTNAAYWQRATGGEDFSLGGRFAVPRLVVSKGISLATVSASYAAVTGTDIKVLGGAVDMPIINGGLISPTLALRGSYSQLQGVEEYDLSTYGVELFLSKGFGPLTPYAAVGRARSIAEGRIIRPDTGAVLRTITDEADTNRITVGVRLSMFLPKIVVEATQGEERSYAAKVSFGL